MSRIEPVPTSKAGLWGRFAYWMTRRRYGDVPEPFAVMRHHRGVSLAVAMFELANEKASHELSKRLRELVVYRVATKVECEWCVDFGTMLMRLDGLDIERLRTIDDYPTSELFDDTERLALAYADAMTSMPTAVTDEMVTELDTRLGHRGLVELTHSIALENMRARFNSALGITGQGFDAACQVKLAPVTQAAEASRG